MKTTIRSLAVILALQPALAYAGGGGVANYPATLPQNTVIGRSGIGPGPSQPIPFSVLRTFIGSAVTIGGSPGPVFVLDPTLHMTGSTLGVVTGTFGATIPLNSGNNTFTGNDTFSGTNSFSGANSFTGAVTFNGSATLPNQPAYSWLLNNTSAAAAPTPVTVGSLTLNGSPNASTTTLPCETAGVLGKCTAGSLAGSLTTGLTTFGGSSGPSIALDSNTLLMTGTTESVNTGTSGHTIPFLDGTNIFSGVTEFSAKVGFGTASPSNDVTILQSSDSQAAGGFRTYRHSGASSASLFQGGDDNTYLLNNAAAGAVYLFTASGGFNLAALPNGKVQFPNYTTAGCLANDASGNISTTTCGGPSTKTSNVQALGADPTGSADSQPAFQAAVTAMQSGTTTGVFIPCGTYKLNSTVTAGNGNFAIHSDTSCVIININFNGAAFSVNNTTPIYYGSFLGVTCLWTGSSSNVTSCLQFNGSTAVEIAYWKIGNIRCLGINTCIRNARNVNVGGEAEFDWNHFFDIQTTNYGGNPTYYAFYADNGSGTGNVYEGMNLVVGNGGLFWGGANNANVGDIEISSIEFGGGGAAIEVSAGAYRGNITIRGVQCDGGIVSCVTAPNTTNMSLIGLSYGGPGTPINNTTGATRLYCGSSAC